MNVPTLFSASHDHMFDSWSRWTDCVSWTVWSSSSGDVRCVKERYRYCDWEYEVSRCPNGERKQEQEVECDEEKCKCKLLLLDVIVVITMEVL